MEFPQATAQYITEEGKCRIIQVTYKHKEMLIYVNFFPPVDAPTITKYIDKVDHELFLEYIKLYKFSPYKYYVKNDQLKGIYFYYSKQNKNFLFYKKLSGEKLIPKLPVTNEKIFILERFDPTFENYNRAVQLLNFLIFLYNRKHKKFVIDSDLYEKNFDAIQNSNNWESLLNIFWSKETTILPNGKTVIAFENKEMNNFYEKSSNTYIKSKNHKTLYFNNAQEIQTRINRMRNNFRNEIFSNIPADFWARKEFYIYNFYFLDYFPYNSVLLITTEGVKEIMREKNYSLLDIKGNLLSQKKDDQKKYVIKLSDEQYALILPLNLMS